MVIGITIGITKEYESLWINGIKLNALFLANALKISGYPTIVFFAENGDLIQPVVGYKTPKQLELYLKMIANDDYKKLTTSESWQEYQNNFKSTF